MSFAPGLMIYWPSRGNDILVEIRNMNLMVVLGKKVIQIKRIYPINYSIILLILSGLINSQANISRDVPQAWTSHACV